MKAMKSQTGGRYCSEELKNIQPIIFIASKYNQSVSSKNIYNLSVCI